MTYSKKRVYTGKTKIVFNSDQGMHFLVQHFTDSIISKDSKSTIVHGKGIINNYISEFFMTKLEEIGIRTHFVKNLNIREQLVKKVETIPLKIVIRNVAAGNICERLNLKEGKVLENPVLEFFYKNKDLNFPLVTDDHIICLDLLNVWELEELKSIAFRINDFLSGAFSVAGMKLIDFKVEFGFYEDEIFLCDEITPDTCRLRDIKINGISDKNRFSLSLGSVVDHYKEIAKRLGIFKNIFK